MKNAIIDKRAKKAVVVGATSGIGLEISKRLLAEGWTVGVAGRRTEELQRLKALNDQRVFARTIDITLPDSEQQLLQLIDEMGGIELLVLSSGVGFQNPRLDPDLEYKTVETNALGFVRMVTAAYTYFRDNGGGHIAAISSIAGTKGLGVSPSYSATKRFQWVYMEALSQQSNMAKANVRFIDIRPGFVQTALLNDDKRYPMLMSPQKVADKIMKAIKRRRRVVVIDWRYRVLVFVWRLVPRCIWERLRIEN